MESAVIATIIGTSGTNLALSMNRLAGIMETAVTIAPSNTHRVHNFNILISDQHNRSDNAPVIYHL